MTTAHNNTGHNAITLRPYQQQGISDIRAAYQAGAQRVLYVLPTGGGKTVMFSYIARGAAARGTRTCLMVHREELVNQICAALNAPHGVIMRGHKQTEHLLQVASVQSLVRRLDRYEFDLIVVDEAHHTNASTYLKILKHYPRARVLGVTATPVRSDGKGLGDVYEDLITGPSTAELTAAGYLTPARVYAPSVIDTTGIRKQAGDYARGALEQRILETPSITGDTIEHYSRLCDGRPAIAFCVSVQHAQVTADSFTTAGYRAVSIDGKMPRDQIQAAIQGLTTGEVQVLTSCDLISEGLDVPGVEAALLLRPTQSMGLCRQQVGRALRIAPGKTQATILDHAGNCIRHGLPDEDITWTLDTTRGYEQAEAQEPEVRARQCQRCFYVHAWAPVCPQCGYVYQPSPREIEEREGELRELVARQRRQEVGRARDREALEQIARDRGYKQGWVHFMLKSRGQKRSRKEVQV